MIDLLFKLLEYVTKASEADDKQRKRTLEQHIDPLYRQLEQAHAELVRALQAVRTAMHETSSLTVLQTKIQAERQIGRANRTAAYSQAVALREALHPHTDRAAHQDRPDVRSLRNRHSKLFVRKRLLKTLDFVVACEDYFQWDGMYWHELRHLYEGLGAQILMFERRALRPPAGTSSDGPRTQPPADENLRAQVEQLLEYCDFFLEFRNLRWQTVTTAFAKCRVELLDL